MHQIVFHFAVEMLDQKTSFVEFRRRRYRCYFACTVNNEGMLNLDIISFFPYLFIICFV